MPGKTAKIELCSGDDAATLKRLYQTERDALVKTLLHWLWLVRPGEQINPASRLVGVHPRSATRWILGQRFGSQGKSAESFGRGRAEKSAPAALLA